MTYKAKEKRNPERLIKTLDNGLISTDYKETTEKITELNQQKSKRTV
jgi:hypothetical protein